jgi:hypothetical protein
VRAGGLGNSCRGVLLCFHFDLRTQHGQLWWSFNSDANSPAGDANDGHRYPIADQNAFANLARENEHRVVLG